MSQRKYYAAETASFGLEQPLPTNMMSEAGYVSEDVNMALNLLASGYATLEYEIAQEKASALGRLGRRLDRLVEQAGYALWLLAVQREACGLNNLAHVLQVYRVPNEVAARMGPLAMPGIHPAESIGA
jgi:hypothetical protein